MKPFWNRSRPPTAVQRRLLSDCSDDASLETIAERPRSISIITQPSEIETFLTSAAAPFEGPQFDTDELSISSSTLLLLRNGAALQDIIETCPEDVLTVLQDMIVAPQGSFKAKDSDVLRALRRCTLLTRGLEVSDDPYWETHWKEIIDSHAKCNAGKFASVGWEEMVTMSAYVLQLKDIAKPEKGDLIQLLLQKSSAGAAPKCVWEFPAVRAVIDYHWEHWTKKVLLGIFFLIAAWMVSFAGYLCLYIGSSVDGSSCVDDEVNEAVNSSAIFSNRPRASLPSDTESGIPGESRNGSNCSPTFGAFSDDPVTVTLTYIFNILSFAFMCPLALEEYWTMISMGRGWIQFQNLVDITTNTLQVFIFLGHILNFGLETHWFGCVLAAQGIFLSFRILRFFRLLGEGTTFLDTALSVIYSVRCWIFYVIFIGIAASLSLGALYKQDKAFQSSRREFESVEHSLVTTFQIVFGNFDPRYIFDAEYHWMTFLVFLGFQILMTITVLNLLIAAMSNSYAEVALDKQVQMYRGRAEVINEIGGLRLPSFLLERPASYIHFLVVDHETKTTALSKETCVEPQDHSIDELRKEVRDLSLKMEELKNLVKATLGARVRTGGTPVQ